jgi:hypothetical protein
MLRLARQIAILSLFAVSRGYAQSEQKSHLSLKVSFFALAEHFGETSENLEAELNATLSYFTAWALKFKNEDFALNVSYSLRVLNTSDIYYPYWTDKLLTDDVFNGFHGSPAINSTWANMKILLLPDINSQELMAGYAGSVSGVALQDPYGALEEIEQFAVAKIQTRRTFVDNNVPKKNGVYGLNRYKYNPKMFYVSPLFTKAVRSLYLDIYGNRNGKGEYLQKLANDLWTNRNDMDKMKNIAVAVHQFGHLLGATECMALGPWDGTNIMCSPAGTNLSAVSAAQIHCRIQQNYFDRRSHVCKPRQTGSWWWRSK